MLQLMTYRQRGGTPKIPNTTHWVPNTVSNTLHGLSVLVLPICYKISPLGSTCNCEPRWSDDLSQFWGLVRVMFILGLPDPKLRISVPLTFCLWTNMTITQIYWVVILARQLNYKLTESKTASNLLLPQCDVHLYFIYSFVNWLNKYLLNADPLGIRNLKQDRQNSCLMEITF